MSGDKCRADPMTGVLFPVSRFRFPILFTPRSTCSPARTAAGCGCWATIEDRAVIEKILRHLDLPIDPPIPAAARVSGLLPGFD